MLYLAIFLLVLLLVIVSSYPIRCFLNFSFWDKFVKHKIIRFMICLLPFIIIYLFFGFINMIVIVLHLAIFMGLAKLFIWLYYKLSKRKFDVRKNNDLRNIVAIILTIIYLSIGAYLDYHVFETKYTLYTDKEINDFRIVLISDSHIGATFNGDGFYKHMEKLSKIDTDIFIVAGDFVDDDTEKEDMIKACSAFSLLKPKDGIYYVYGNHDRGYFNNRDFNEEDLVRELEKNNVIVLSDEVKEINNIYLIGREDKSNKNRLSIDKLVEGLDKDHYMISINHQPNDYENESLANIDLVLSGHSHGGQMWPLGTIGLLLNQNDSFYGLERRNNTDFIVTSGISDWALIFKTGTKSEYVIIDIKKNLSN